MLLPVATALATPPPPPSACSDGAIAAPDEATWGGACFSLTAQRASSLRQCVEWCGKQGMTPACIASADENAFVPCHTRSRTDGSSASTAAFLHATRGPRGLLR